MKAPNEKYWTEISQKFSKLVVDAIKQKFLEDESFTVYADEIILDDPSLSPEVDDFLLKLCNDGFLNYQKIILCSSCKRELEEDILQNETNCPSCNTFFEEATPIERKKFFFTGDRKRDIIWIFVIHGMNTTGKWQEEFSWQISNLYGYSIPVAIFKYGKIITTPFLRPLWKKFINRTEKNIKRYINDISKRKGHKVRPDIIAHSFGTLLISEILLKDKDLKLGRIILTGSIIRPDYDWEILFKRGQIEGVLCNTAGKDIWSKIAHYWIANSGPSGFLGFNQKEFVELIHFPKFKHSDFFGPTFKELIENKWKHFLTKSKIYNPKTNGAGTKLWKPKRLRRITFAIKYLIILTFFLILLISIFSIFFGLPILFKIFIPGQWII